MNAADNATPARGRLVEIWGDTADLGHLAWSIAIGVGVSLAGYLVASRVLAGAVSTPELARAYAMLAGLGGCVLSGLVCARLFAPKREVVEGGEVDPRWREEVLAELAGEHGDLGSVDDLPPAVAREMKELELHALFAAYRPRARGPEGAAP
ncbi:hypothetical protein M2165_002012 [Variovorax sp. TBS-050B]|uniref:hypothetical protein n=1 Tax=Variovorax sp. TBS-050B TaxID=2940551 RepID=UPI0024754D6B|nr:hypothetical protein [Variovorax sp. TBS-050B]MDH6592123.1 hypothetical protein [Variovorax sp. TBS-050B]